MKTKMLLITLFLFIFVSFVAIGCSSDNLVPSESGTPKVSGDIDLPGPSSGDMLVPDGWAGADW